MVRVLKRILGAAFAVVISLSAFTGFGSNSVPHAAAEYDGGYTTVGGTTMPLAEYMPGTFFSKDGTACDCHNDSSINCVSSGSRCNCLRYVTIDGVSVDLQAVQCIGFARYVFYRLFGFADTSSNSARYHSVGSLDKGEVTAASVKTLISQAKPGAHIRFKLAYTQHSVIILSIDESGFVAYQANSGGDGVSSASCVVSTKKYSWARFAEYAYRGIVYVNMPNSYPGFSSGGSSVIDPTENYPVGLYVTTDNLSLRQGAGVSFPRAEVLPKGTEFTVTETAGNWGKTTYNGSFGWVCLDYAAFIGAEGNVDDSPDELRLTLLTPKPGTALSVSGGILYGIAANTKLSGLSELFENEKNNLALTVLSTRYVGTNSVITLTKDEEVIDEVYVVVRGDLNGDGQINDDDSVLTGRLLRGLGALDERFTAASDLNGDGARNSVDYITQLMKTAK